MNYRHNPDAMPTRDDDGTGFVDAADLAFELERDDSDACAMLAAGDDE